MRKKYEENFTQCILNIKEGNLGVKDFMELFYSLHALTQQGAVWSSLENLVQDTLFPPVTTLIPLSVEQAHVLFRIVKQQFLILDEYPFARDEKAFAQINELHHDMMNSGTADQIAVFYEIYRPLLISLVSQKFNIMNRRKDEDDYCGSYDQVNELFCLLTGEAAEETSIEE